MGRACKSSRPASHELTVGVRNLPQLGADGMLRDFLPTDRAALARQSNPLGIVRELLTQLGKTDPGLRSERSLRQSLYQPLSEFQQPEPTSL